MQRTTALLGSAIFFIIAPCVAVGLIPFWITRWQFQSPLFGPELTRFFGGGFILAGIPVIVDSFVRFALEGLGTPAPVAPPRQLVVTGLYRHVRNPIYVSNHSYRCWPSSSVRRLASHRIRRAVLVRSPPLRCAVRGTYAATDIRGCVFGLSRQCSALDSPDRSVDRLIDEACVWRPADIAKRRS